MPITRKRLVINVAIFTLTGFLVKGIKDKAFQRTILSSRLIFLRRGSAAKGIERGGIITKAAMETGITWQACTCTMLYFCYIKKTLPARQLCPCSFTGRVDLWQSMIRSSYHFASNLCFNAAASYEMQKAYLAHVEARFCICDEQFSRSRAPLVEPESRKKLIIFVKIKISQIIVKFAT